MPARQVKIVRRLAALARVSSEVDATFTDSNYKDAGQKNPGEIISDYYDVGGEGVAHHDTDAQNKGSNELIQ
jgi:hypothetical protein